MPLDPSLTRGTFARLGDPLLIRTNKEKESPVPVYFVFGGGGGKG